MGITNAKITNLTIETARIEPLLPIQEEIQEVVIRRRILRKEENNCYTSLINKNNS